MGTVLADLRFGVRTLRRAPAFTTVAILTLALGIGANTAIFSVVNALLLQPLPYPGADRLVMVWQDMRARGGPAQEWATPGNVADWQSSGIFAAVTAVQGWAPVLSGSGDPEPLVGEMVTHQYFGVLGVAPQLGRSFQPADDVPNAARVVVLGHGLWERRFGADPAIVGRTITLAGESHEIVGVMPAGFRPGVVADAELWRPRRLDLANPSRGAVVLRVIARLAPERTLEQTAGAADELASRLAAQYPEWNKDVRFSIATLHSQIVGDIKPGLLLLLAAVAFVMLIACANIANLLLARASSRGREMAVRLALGAGRGRIVRQLLTESLVLSVAGGMFGLLVGVWGISALVAAAPAGAPRVNEIGLDPSVLAYAVLLTLVTAVLFGMVPALHAARMTVAPALKEGGRATSAGSGLGARRALIVFEVAIAMALLVAGGLLTRTLVHLQTFDLGFEPARVLVGQINPARTTYETPESVAALYDRLLDRAAALPGVEIAALSSVLPLGGDSDMDITIEGRPAPATPGEATTIWYRIVSHDYFRAMGITITRGRGFERGEAAPVAVVSEAAARRYWGDADPIGRRVGFGDPKRPWFTIVGVANEVHMRGARGESVAEAYLPYWQRPELGTNIVLKTAGDPASAIAPLRQAALEVDGNLPVARVAPMSAIVARSIEQPRFVTLLVGLFAALALSLAAVGIYGLIAFSVARRTPEIGVRIALGASRREVLMLVVREGVALTVAGVAIGVVLAAVAGSGMKTLLFGVEPVDPLTFAAVGACLLATAVAASLLPALRAARVDPMVALRSE